MGRMQAEEMAQLTDLDTALSWHLRSNHYPPIPLSMLAACKAAIAAYDSETDTDILLPLGVRWRGQVKAPASAIISEYHLGSFLTRED